LEIFYFLGGQISASHRSGAGYSKRSADRVDFRRRASGAVAPPHGKKQKRLKPVAKTSSAGSLEL
jgi:hypothetical protein